MTASGTARGRIASAAVLALILALGAWAFVGLPVRSSITDFVPVADGEEDLTALMRALADAPASRAIALTFGPTDEITAARAAGLLGERLRAVPGIASVEDGAPEDVDRAIYELYFPRRYAFLALRPGDVPAMLDEAALRERARALKSALTGPTAMLVRRIAPEDPLLAFPDALRALRGVGSAEGPRLFEEHLVVDDPRLPEGARTFGVVLAQTEGTTFSAELQGPVLEAIERAGDAVRAELSTPDLLLEQASVHRFAVRTETVMRSETSFISAVSMIGIALLFVGLFRGPRYLLLGSVPLVVGTIAATATCRIVFGGVHGITLAFGSALLGVGIDYSGHYIAHHVLEPEPGGATATMKKLWPGLSLGAGTTVLGLLGLGLTSLPGMQELGVFAGVGVLGSLLSVWLLPPWMPARPMATPQHQRLAAWLGAMMGQLEHRPRIGWALAAVAIAIAMIGLPQLTFVDDLRALNEVDPAMSAEDQRVRERLARGEAGRVAVAIGEDDEEALAHAEAMTVALEDAVAAGELRGFRSASAMLRSERTQRDVLAAVTGDATLGPRMLAALEAEGFVPSMFAPFEASIAVRPEPITPAMVMTSPLAPLVRPFRLEVAPEPTHPAGRVAYLALLAGIDDEDALATRLGAVPGARLFDQGDYLHAAYRTFRERATLLVLAGLIMVLGLCWARYRSLRMGLASIAPALVASATSLGVVALIGEPANLMHLVACLLVLSMGEDYAVFLLEMKDEPTGPATTMVGLLIASLTTVLSFGLLAFSSHPALRALGIVTSLGVLLSLVLAPISLRLVKR